MKAKLSEYQVVYPISIQKLKTLRQRIQSSTPSQALQVKHSKFGTRFSDFMTGSAVSDEIFGLDGNDAVRATSGNDYIDGSNGFDTVDYTTLNRSITLLSNST
ncbi:MAG: hypothetical protein EDM05_006045 [Leptolyngbya sp. IPPAS B-1204]|nr:MAG: calcium-binding protein [Leptolyngbya sp. IPPAS B-1204]